MNKFIHQCTSLIVSGFVICFLASCGGAKPQVEVKNTEKAQTVEVLPTATSPASMDLLKNDPDSADLAQWAQNHNTATSIAVIHETPMPNVNNYYATYSTSDLEQKLHQHLKTMDEETFIHWVTQNHTWVPSPYLALASALLYKQQKPEESLKWAQRYAFRSFYDLNRCTDARSANVAAMEFMLAASPGLKYGEEHAALNLKTLEKTREYAQAYRNKTFTVPTWACAQSLEALSFEEERTPIEKFTEAKENWPQHYEKAIASLDNWYQQYKTGSEGKEPFYLLTKP